MRCWRIVRTSWRSSEEKRDRACTHHALTSVDIEALARAVRERVRAAYGVTLVPEPVTVGITW